jgi:alpha/beta superfamily hydrolase
MNTNTQRFLIEGPAGSLEVARDTPTSGHAGTLLIAHPHPLFQGTMDNKVVQTLARAALQKGWTAVRFNFRGVGKSEGNYGGGDGELEDWLAVKAQLASTGPLAIAGFSFGAFVTCRALATFAAGALSGQEIQHAVLVGTAVSRFDVPAIPPAFHERTLVIHGEADDTVSLADVMSWARPQHLPVSVVPDVGHFFHGQLPLLKYMVSRHLSPPQTV